MSRGVTKKKNRVTGGSLGAPSPVVFAVVLHWNAFEATAACVASLERATYRPLEILIVDNGSSDRSGDAVARKFKRHHTLRLPTNAGYARGNNEGIRYSLARGADYVLLLNNDVIVEKDFLEPLIFAAEKDPLAGVLTGKAYLDDSHGRRYTTGGRFSPWRCNIAPLLQRHAEIPRTVNAVSGCFLLVRREVFETVGLLNEDFFLYFEDLEFSRRVAKRYSLLYVPASVIQHKSGAGVGWRSYSPTYLFHSTRSRFLAFRSEPAWYRVYVALFSGLNVAAKSLWIFPSMLGSTGERGRTKEKLGALWRGLKEGITISSIPQPRP